MQDFEGARAVFMEPISFSSFFTGNTAGRQAKVIESVEFEKARAIILLKGGNR
jgi:hypothetical protein